MTLRRRIERVELAAYSQSGNGSDLDRVLLAVMRVEGESDSIAWLYPGERIASDDEDVRIAQEGRQRHREFFERFEKAWPAVPMDDADQSE